MPEINAATSAASSGDNTPSIENLQTMKVGDGFFNTSKSLNNTLSICSNCGKEGSNLKSCAACKLEKYCSRECQSAHRPQHKNECRKRAAELHVEKLFKVPPPKEDCPICFLRMPSLWTGYRYNSCCGKVICSGCINAHAWTHFVNDDEACPFCRTPAPDTEIDAMERNKERVKTKDPVATFCSGNGYSAGDCGLPQDFTKALELWHQAGELGHAEAYQSIGNAYCKGTMGLDRDEMKAIYYYELAAMRGDSQARFFLGCIMQSKGNFKKALKHYIISVEGGDGRSTKAVQKLYMKGYATKDDYTKALRLYQAHLAEVKSDQRDKAVAYDEQYKYYI